MASSASKQPENESVARLPGHLRQFIVDQGYERYTPIDHAVWRFIMRQNLDFLRGHAHAAYVDGLRRTGISVERIPRIEEMNEILGRIGWGAVTVDGFIPPAAFMEYQAYKVLVIAADMRQIDHIEYTPAPDIVHEAAGHAPIIADEVYAEYLRRFGEYGAKAFSSAKDFELYEAIRHLSILKEAPNADEGEVGAAERAVEELQANLGEPSEMARLSRLHWWTVEFGLIGELDDPKIYGAGLLSSIGESSTCLTDRVKKIPYSAGAADVAFDITTQQPQLFVTPDFEHLLAVLEEFASGMAFRRGGTYGLEVARESANTATFEYSSGLQVSGTVSEVVVTADGTPAWVRTAGPSALAFAGRQVPGHGKATHADGFGAPVGRVIGLDRPLEDMDEDALRAAGIAAGERARLVLESGVEVEGRLERVERRSGRTVLLSFSDCRATLGEEVLFDPSWGTFDMPVGARIGSVFSGAADKDAFEEVALVPRTRTVKVEFDERTRSLGELYRRVRDVRESREEPSALPVIWQQLLTGHPDDWLASLEILEVMTTRGVYPELAGEIRVHLEAVAAQRPERAKPIGNGLRLLGLPLAPTWLEQTRGGEAARVEGD